MRLIVRLSDEAEKKGLVERAGMELENEELDHVAGSPSSSPDLVHLVPRSARPCSSKHGFPWDGDRNRPSGDAFWPIFGSRIVYLRRPSHIGVGI